MNFKIFVSILLIMFFFTVSNASAEIGMVVNQLSNRTSVPNYKLWNDSTWSASANATNVNGTIRWVVLKNNPLRYEKILGTLDSSNDVKVQFYNGTVWSNTVNMTLTASTSTYRAFDIAVEQQSGNVMVAYDNGTAGQLAYKIWNGTAWSGQENISTNGTGNSNWVRLESRPNSNGIILVTLDTNSDIFARVWNGTNWDNATTLETTAETAAKGDFDVVYEQSSGDALVVWADAATANPRYRTYINGTWSEELSATTSASQAATYQWMRMKSYPDADRIMLCTADADSDLNCVQWSGSSWGTTNEIDATIEYIAASFRNFDITPETASGGFAMIYGNSDDDFYTFCRCNSNSNCNTGTWETCQTFLNSVDIGTDTSWGYLEFDPISAGNITAIMTDQSSNTQWRARIGCTASANSCILVEGSTSLGSSTSSIYESAMFSYTPIMPNMTSISTSPNPIKGGNTITITADAVNDTNNNKLYFYCDSSNTPTSSNTDCKGGNTVDTSPPYDLTCTFPTAQTDQSNTIYCRVYDGYYYSQAKSTTYTTDSTAPITSIVNVAGDTATTYYDNVNDDWTNITISGEVDMLCRWATSDSSYSSMTNDCTVTGTQALCSPITTTQGLDAYNFYVSCQDSVGNEQNSTNNLDVTALVTDWTVPTTSDNSSTTIVTPNYAVLITESDNLFSAATITTYYCTDTIGSCTPTTSIGDGETITFTFSNRGINFFRYNSSDPAGNIQTIQNKTININQLPVLTSASDNATTVKGGSGVRVATVSSDADSGQILKLYVCNSTSADYNGCVDNTYCSNTSATENPICDFTSEVDSSTHTWYAFIYDELNESAATNTSGSYTTDSSPPNIVILNPSNTTYSQTSVDAAVLTSEAASWTGYCLDACSSNTTLTSVTSTYWSKTMTVGNGAHYIVFYANDSYGSMGNSSTRYFSVDTTLGDTTLPGITISSPTNNSNSSSTSIWVNITTDENLAWAGYSLNGTTTQSMSGSLTTWYVQLTNLGNAYHNMTVYANDSSANRNQANKSISFYADTSAPQSSQVGTNFSTVNRSQSVSCFAYWTDNFNSYSGKVAENSTGSFENHTVLSNGWTNYTVAGSVLSLGRYTCIFYAADYAGNENSTSTSFTVQDIEAPVITIRAPDNTTYSQNSTTAEIIANEDLSWAGYCLDACSSNVTMTDVSSTLWTTTVSSMSNGVHFITFYGNDSSGNMGSSSTIYFSVDTTLGDTAPPTITIWSPTDGTYYTSASILVNITLSEAGSSAVYSLNGAANVSMGSTSATNWNYTLTNLADETQHNITFYATDTSSNNNTGNKSITFFMDRKAPFYSSAAANPSTANQSQPVSCSAYWTDGLSIASGKVAENSTGSFVNHTVSISGINDWTNYTIQASDLSVAGFMCIFYATDSAGNSNTTNTTFTVQDVVAPTITTNSPTNATFNQNWVAASITLSEAGKWANCSIDGTANVSMSNSSSTIWNATVSSLSNAVHTLTFYASDVHDNIGTSSVSFTIDTTVFDTTPPSITVWSPTNGTCYTTASILANITLSEAGSSAVYSLNGTANQTMGNVSSTNWNKTLTLANGLNNITFYANDTSTNRNTGNSSTIFFYVDTSAPQNTSQGPTSGNDTVDITCYSQWTDNLALDYGYLEHNATGTAINSSQISLSGTSGWTNATIASADTTPGIIQCKAYAYDKAGLVNTTSWVINVTDATNPAVENISYLPNTTDSLDPNVMVNITANASDNVALSSVIIQYKLNTSGSWSESLMSLATGSMYIGNFTPTAGNWSFRIFANDTSNNTNTSSVRNISVALDYSWVNISTTPTTKSIVRTEPREINLGNLTVNNTGDYDLNFTVTSNKNWITFNGTNTSLIFIVNSTFNSTKFNVTANTTGFAVGNYSYSITINSYTLNPHLVSSQTLDGTVVIQNVAGPYFVVSIAAYDSSVTQGDSGITLTATLENAGTADATNTWFAWSIPSGWTNTSGILNQSIGFLGIGSTVTNSINVSVGSSATTGSQAVTISAGCAEGMTGSDSKTVTVGSVTTVTTAPPAAAAGISGGGAGTGSVIGKVLAGKEILGSSETFDLVRGYSNSFPVTVKNIFEKTTLNNVSIKIEGYLSQYMSISPSIISKINYGETKQFNVTITSPEYMEKGIHQLTIIITAKIIGTGVEKDLTDTRDVKLAIHTVSEEEVNASIDKATAYISEMTNAGFPTEKVSKLLDQAKKALENHEYDDAKGLIENINEIRGTAFEANSIMQEIKSKIKTYGSITGVFTRLKITGAFISIPTRFTETEDMVNLAQAAFERGDFDAALQRAKDAQMTFALEKGEFNPIFFLADYWWAILMSMGILSVSGLFGYQTYQRAVITQRIINLKKEEDTIRELMIESQRKRFTENVLGPETFNKIISQYQQRLSKIMKLRIKLRHKRTRILKPQDVVKDLEGERKEISNLLKELQKGYFVKRNISKAEYSEQTRVYNERLAEIEDEQMVLETKMYVGEKK